MPMPEIQIRIGNTIIPKDSILRIKTHISISEQGKASLKLKDNFPHYPLWNNLSECSIEASGKRIFTGVITTIRHYQGYILVNLSDASWNSRNTQLSSDFKTNFTHQEVIYWLCRFAGFKESQLVIDGLILNRKKRLFRFWIPVIGTDWLSEFSKQCKTWSWKPTEVIFYKEQFEEDPTCWLDADFLAKNPIWKAGNVRAESFVSTTDFLEAEGMAFEKARKALDALLLATSFSDSHLPFRKGKIKEWDRALAFSKPRLSRWIFLYDVKEDKWLIRESWPETPSTKLDFSKTTRYCKDVLEALTPALIRDSLFWENKVSPKIKKEIGGESKQLKLALWWLGNANREINLEFKSIFLCNALESVLNSHKYPDFLSPKEKVKIKDIIKNEFAKMKFQNERKNLIEKTLLNRLLSSDDEARNFC